MPRLDRRELAVIFLGGMVGAVLRVWISRQFTSTAPSWPWATFLINITGSAALAYLATRLERRRESTYWRPLLATGLCGTYTTFSTMQVEILKMLDLDRDGLALAYAVASIAGGYLAISFTTALVRRARVSS